MSYYARDATVISDNSNFYWDFKPRGPLGKRMNKFESEYTPKTKSLELRYDTIDRDIGTV